MFEINVVDKYGNNVYIDKLGTIKLKLVNFKNKGEVEFELGRIKKIGENLYKCVIWEKEKNLFRRTTPYSVSFPYMLISNLPKDMCVEVIIKERKTSYFTCVESILESKIFYNFSEKHGLPLQIYRELNHFRSKKNL